MPLRQVRFVPEDAQIELRPVPIFRDDVYVRTATQQDLDADWVTPLSSPRPRTATGSSSSRQPMPSPTSSIQTTLSSFPTPKTNPRRRQVTPEVQESHFAQICLREHPLAIIKDQNVHAVWLTCHDCRVHVSFRHKFRQHPTVPIVIERMQRGAR